MADWPFLGRGDEVYTVVASCLRGRGIVLAGPPGVGKTRLAEVAVQRLATRGRQPRFLMATPTSAAISFGIFGTYSSARFPGDPVAAAEDILGGDTPGSTVALLDDAHLLDVRSAALVRRLATEGSITIVITIRTGERAPDDITALWRDGIIPRLDLGPLHESDLVSAAEAALGGALESFSARRLTNLSAGNALYFRHLVEGQLEAGRLVSAGGIWRLAGPVWIPPGLADLISARLSRIGASVRDALDIVALAGPLDLKTLVRLTSTAATEQAERDGLLAIDDPAGVLVVRVAHPLLGEIAIGALSLLRARRLRGRIVEELARTTDDPAMILKRAILALDADIEPDADLLAAGASQALASGQPEMADRLAGAALAAGGGFAAQAVRVFSRTWDALDPKGAPAEFALLNDLERTPDEGVLAVLHRALYLAWGATHDVAQPPAALRLLEKAAEQWPLAPALGVCHAMFRVALGECSTDDPLAARILADPHASTEATTFASVACAMQSLLEGRIVDCRAATARGVTVSLTAGEFGVFAVSLRGTEVGALALAGSIHAAVGVAADVKRLLKGTSAHEFLGLCLATDAAAASGHARQAIRDLDEVWARVTTDADAGCLRSMTAIRLCRAHAMLGNVDDAQRWRREMDTSWHPAFEMYASERLLAHAAALAAEGAVNEAAELAVAAADLARERGHHGYELLALQQALQYGEDVVAQRLNELAVTMASPRADVAVAFATAVQQGDAAALRETSSKYEAMGDLMAAGDLSAMAFDAFERTGVFVMAQEARVRVRRLSEAAGGARTTRMARCSAGLALTKREWAIAMLAANGSTSRAIADRLVLSVRTVEGHLYRIYQKLGLATRNELRKALGGQ